MKKLLLCFAAVALLCACQRFNIGPKGEGEYVIGTATVDWQDGNTSAIKKLAMQKAEYNAVEHAVKVFLSSSSQVAYPQEVQQEILAKYENYVRKAYINTAYRKGDKYYLEARVMVLVSDLASRIKSLEDSSFVRKTNILVASRDTFNNEVYLKQYCRQGIYKALKNYPYTLFDGGNLSQNNLDNTTPLVDKAKKEGARFVIVAEASASPIENAERFASSFKPMRASVHLRVISVNNYQVIAESSSSQSGLDAVEDIALQKAFSSACEDSAKQVAESIDSAVNSAKTYTFVVKDVNTVERLERLQSILRELREVEDFSLVKYSNSAATFEVQANISTSEEFSAKILRKYYANFTIVATGPDSVELLFI